MEQAPQGLPRVGGAQLLHVSVCVLLVCMGVGGCAIIVIVVWCVIIGVCGRGCECYCLHRWDRGIIFGAGVAARATAFHHNRHYPHIYVRTISPSTCSLWFMMPPLPSSPLLCYARTTHTHTPLRSQLRPQRVGAFVPPVLQPRQAAAARCLWMGSTSCKPWDGMRR